MLTSLLVPVGDGIVPGVGAGAGAVGDGIAPGVGAGAVGDGIAPGVGAGAGSVGDGTAPGVGATAVGAGLTTTLLFIILDGTHWHVAASGSNDNGTGHVIPWSVRAAAILHDAYFFVKSSQ